MWVWQFLYLVDTGGTDGSWEEECYIRQNKHDSESFENKWRQC